MESVASHLLPVAADVRQLAARTSMHAPDPGTPPAPDAVVGVQHAAMEALDALATAFEESSALLVLAARRYQATEDEVARVIDRLDRLDGGPG